MAVSGIVNVASGSETWKISVASTTAGDKILAAATNNPAGNNGSYLLAIKIN
jgi:hypothetical protein